MALGRFEALLKSATPAELAAMDKLVQSQDAFSIYVNLSRKFPQTATTRFVVLPREADDRFLRRGLPWVIALARVELGAMLSGFSKRMDGFQRVGPSSYDAKAYEALLIDSMHLHLWGLQADPLSNARHLRKAALGNEPLALLYERRIRLALKFLYAVREWTGSRMAPAQRDELKQYEEKLHEWLTVIRKDILALGEETASGEDVTKIKGGKVSKFRIRN